MDNEEWVDLSEVILAAELEIGLSKEPFFIQASLPHKLCLASRVLKKMDPCIHVPLSFLSSGLAEELWKIEEWYKDTSQEIYPEYRIAKRCLGTKLHIPSRYKEQMKGSYFRCFDQSFSETG